MEINVNDKNFKKEVLESELPCLVDFWAEWCGPCWMVAPVVEEIAKEYKERLKVCKNGGEKCRTRLEAGDYVYRPGFFVIGKKLKPAITITRMGDKLVWEGHAPLVPQEDFQEIVKKAAKKGLIKPSFLVPSSL